VSAVPDSRGHPAATRGLLPRLAVSCRELVALSGDSSLGELQPMVFLQATCFIRCAYNRNALHCVYMLLCFALHE